MKITKQRFRPYSKEQEKSLLHNVNQMQVKLNELITKRIALIKGIENIKTEVGQAVVQYQAQVIEKEKELKAARIKLDLAHLDLERNMTELKYRTELFEIVGEIKRHEQNIGAMKEQVKKGIPILNDEKEKTAKNDEEKYPVGETSDDVVKGVLKKE